jgi:hypothetical protein
MSNNLPFNNKTFLPLGDFYQVAPVLRHVTAPTTVFDSSIRSSSLWRNFHILHLTRPIRNADDPVYAHFVDQVGDGVPPLTKPFLFIIYARPIRWKKLQTSYFQMISLQIQPNLPFAPF